ncbi:MAG: two pore domain potassium channel family protein [Acidimicrobiia bacterium]|nr:two pore domain potassium channel family protein [Acidimicrobiia bacterium]
MIGLWSILRRFGQAIRRGWTEPEFRGLLSLVAVVVAAGTVFYRAVEGWRWLDSLYFTVITLTTVGYGDISPKTDLGRSFTIVFILVGVGLLLAFIERIARYASEANAEAREKRRGTREG